MKLFNTLCLEISALCNRKCVFCPVAYNKRPDEKMSLSQIHKVCKELGKLDYRGRVEFYIYNEPLKEKEWLNQCVRLFRKNVPRCCMMIATNGDYVKSSKEIQNLYELGMNQILINCYSKGLYKKRQHWIEELDSSVSRSLSVYHALSYKKRTVQMLDKSDPETFGSGVFGLVNRAGNIEDFIPSLEEPLEKMCVKPFRLLNINWQGQGMVCCQDYHGQMPIGHLDTHTLEQMWNSPILNTYRDKLLQKDRTLPLCRTCDCHAGAYTHMVNTEYGKTVSKKKIEQIFQRKKQTSSE